MVRTLVGALFACAVALPGCFTSGEGREPNGERLYYPTGLVVSPGGTTLYVANSDFDLQFSGGSVQALDLAAVRSAVAVIPDTLRAGGSAPDACAAAGLTRNPKSWLNPGPCSHFVLSPFVRSFAFIGAFASGVLLVHNPLADSGQARLFVPVRGDPSITYFEVDDDRGGETGFRLECLKDGGGFCSGFHRLGQDPSRNLRGVQLPADPVGIAATADGVAIVSAHQTQGAASLVINDWDTAPELVYFTGGLPAGPTELASIPEPAFVALAEADAADTGGSFTYQRGFALTFRASAEIDVLRYVPDSGAVPPRPFLTRSDALPIEANQSSFDSRGIAIIDAERRACEATCESVVDRLSCLALCAEEVPLSVFVANRNPAALIVGQLETIIHRALDDEGREVITSASEVLFFYDSIPLNFGPSRVEVGRIVNQAGEHELRVFAVAFDSRSVFMFNPFEHRIEAVIRTGRGPHDLAFDAGGEGDEAFAYLYVGHFTDSYLGVVDLDQRRPNTFGQMFASVGTPTPPKESN